MRCGRRSRRSPWATRSTRERSSPRSFGAGGRARRAHDRATRVEAGATLVTGGGRDAASSSRPSSPTSPDNAELWREELFGPAVAVRPVSGIDEAIALANDTQYGLGAGVFTRDVNHALRFAREVDAGNVHVNWTPLWRADLMPYGGLKGSGIGKEGPRYAVEEMTELKSVVFHGIEG